jgi:imidazolonepropionase-like amidohydrolase
VTTINGVGMPVCGVDEIRKAVRTQIKLGVDCIKVGVTGAESSVYCTTDQTSLSPEELNTLVAEARRFGKMIACHAQSYEGARMAVEAGVTTLEHGTRLDNETIELLARAEDTYLVPTLCTMYSVLELSNNQKQVEEMKINQPLWIESLQKAHEAGVKIAAGSDNGNRYLHGEEAKELEFMVRHGFTEEEALIAATSTASQALHLADRIGTVEKGKFGDLVILNVNPLSDIGVLQKREQIFRVVKAGEILNPNDLAPEVSR